MALIYAFLARKASHSRLTRNIPHGIQRAIHNLSLSALTPFSTCLRLSLELLSLPVSHGLVSLVFFHAVKVYAVMQALRDQVVGHNCLLQDNQSIFLENLGRRSRPVASTDETSRQRFYERALAKMYPRLWLALSRCHQICCKSLPLGIPFLSRSPYTDSQTAEPSMSLRVEAKHEPSVSWKTVTRGDRILPSSR